MYSQSMRDILLRYYGVRVGRYSYGPCLKRGILPPGTVVGRYCSFAEELVVLRRNHPADWLTTHPFLYSAKCGLLEKDMVEGVLANPLTIGNDVWIGARTIILPKCRSIGNGAIIGAGSVVTRDVEPFSIVAGNPARKIKSRFSPLVQARIEESQWWLLSLPELAERLPDLVGLLSEAKHGNFNTEAEY